jgi:alpha-mannosidase
MIVYAKHRRIDYETKADWHEQRQLLKVAFPVHIHAAEATYDIQFGNVTRPTHWNTSWDYARFESVAHQWADLSERNYGVSLMNDCKYGYDIKDNVLRLSLIKAAMVPDPKADQGEHEFIYSLYPHEGDWLQGGTVQAAWSLNNPVRAVYGTAAKETFSLCSLSADHVMIDAVKKAEGSNAILIRLHEFAGMRGKVTLSSDARVLYWQETNLMERPMQDVKQAGEISFEVSPYEIKTFLLYLEE